MAAISDETSGLLGLASLLPSALYGTPHVAQLGNRWVFVNPFIHGWFLTAFNSIMDGSPASTEFTTLQASVSGAEIVVTSPMMYDIIKANEGEGVIQERRNTGLGWTISVVTVGELLLSPSYRLVNVSLTVLLLAMPIVVSYIRGDYSGVGSFIYVVFGLTVRLIENAAYVSLPPRKGRADNPMGLLHLSPMTFTIVLLVSDTNNLINIEHLVHPHLQVRNQQYATLCRRAYQACIGICLVVWLAFLVVSSRSDTQYTNGYVELATMVLSGLGQVVIKQLVTSTVRVCTVQKNCAITAVAWFATRHPLAAAGFPPQLLALRENEEALINALFQHQQTQSQTIIGRSGRSPGEAAELHPRGPPGTVLPMANTGMMPAARHVRMAAS